jgi:uncharacterized protein (TIGR02231 family)
METSVEAPIQAVTVYGDRALIVRRGVVEVPEAGEHILRLGGLPRRLQRTSLRAAGRGPAGTRILGIEQENEIHADPPQEEVQRLGQEITRLRREIELAQARDQIIEEQRQWLRTFGDQSARRMASGIAQSTARPEDASALFTFTGEEAERLAAAKLSLATRQEELQRELEARERELRALSGGGTDRIAASVRMETAAAGELTLELSYLISGASWTPRYDARVDVAASQVGLVEQALVSQQTGEDWRAVSLSLSTAQPSMAVTLPDEPEPWYIDVYTPAPAPIQVAGSVATPLFRSAMAKRAAPAAFRARAEELSLQGDWVDEDAIAAEAAEVQELPPIPPPIPVERAGAAQVFRIPGSVDVPGGGSPHSVSLGEYTLPCRIEYVAAPAIAPGAHRRAIASNTTGAVLLPGELHVFQAGAGSDEYVGATRLELSAEGADIKLFLGVDDNMTVKRELVERETDRGTLLQSGIRRITFGYRVTLTNRTAAPQRVTLLDRLPVPRHERIKLKVLDLRPQPDTRTRLEQLSWNLQLAPDQQQRVEWRFLIEAPADLNLGGLP